MTIDALTQHTIPAAWAAEVPERSLYRAVDAGEIPSTIRHPPTSSLVADPAPRGADLVAGGLVAHRSARRRGVVAFSA